jgi:hypothetical protein
MLDHLKLLLVLRDDTNEEVFIHRTDIAKGNPKKAKKSVGDEEKVEFDIVQGLCSDCSIFLQTLEIG